MNLADILILLAVVLAVVLAVRKLRKNRSEGRCTCGCDGCGSASVCGGKRPAAEKPESTRNKKENTLCMRRFRKGTEDRRHL